MTNKEVNKSYKEYSINFLINKIEEEKKKLAILYQDLYKFKEDNQRYLQILTNEKNMMQAIFINSPAINQCESMELTEKLHEIIKAEREGKQKESEKESQIRLSMAKLDDLRGSLDFLLISGKKFSQKSNVAAITGDDFWASHYHFGDDVDGNKCEGNLSFLGGNQDTTDGAEALPSAPLLDTENELYVVNFPKSDSDFESTLNQNDNVNEAKYQNNFLKPEKEELPCPECPVCFEKMMPPTRIMQCSNGHLICKECVSKANIIDCPTCRMKIVGRATAMEQHLASLFQGFI